MQPLQLEEVKINGCSQICEGAFFGCENLKKVELPEGLIDIRYRAFDECYNLKEINLPSTIQNVGELAFCNIPAQLKIPETVHKIDQMAFAYCFGVKGKLKFGKLYSTLTMKHFLGVRT